MMSPARREFPWRLNRRREVRQRARQRATSLASSCPSSASGAIAVVDDLQSFQCQVFVDLFRLRRQAEILTHRALHDALTGLPNRTLLLDRLEIALARVDRTQKPIALLFIDLDRFKQVNDTLGHHAGDRLLRDAAGRLRAVLRSSDTVARLGGDEFAILLPNCERTVAAVIVERLCSDLPAGQTCSAGLVAWDGAEGPEALVGRADTAMYQAKNAGRNRIVAAH